MEIYHIVHQVDILAVAMLDLAFTTASIALFSYIIKAKIYALMDATQPMSISMKVLAIASHAASIARLAMTLRIAPPAIMEHLENLLIIYAFP